MTSAKFIFITNTFLKRSRNVFVMDMKFACICSSRDMTCDFNKTQNCRKYY